MPAKTAQIIESEVCTCGDPDCDEIQEWYLFCPHCEALITDYGGSGIDDGIKIKCDSCGKTIIPRHPHKIKKSKEPTIDERWKQEYG